MYGQTSSAEASETGRKDASLSRSLLRISFATGYAGIGIVLDALE